MQSLCRQRELLIFLPSKLTPPFSQTHETTACKATYVMNGLFLNDKNEPYLIWTIISLCTESRTFFHHHHRQPTTKKPKKMKWNVKHTQRRCFDASPVSPSHPRRLLGGAFSSPWTPSPDWVYRYESHSLTLRLMEILKICSEWGGRVPGREAYGVSRNNKSLIDDTVCTNTISLIKERKKLFHTVLFNKRRSQRNKKSNNAQPPETINSSNGSTSSSLDFSFSKTQQIKRDRILKFMKREKMMKSIVALLRFNYGCLFTSSTFN